MSEYTQYIHLKGRRSNSFQNTLPSKIFQHSIYTLVDYSCLGDIYDFNLSTETKKFIKTIKKD